MPQAIVKDTWPQDIFNTHGTSYVNIDMCSPVSFCSKLNKPMPPMPITAATYLEHGLPFYKHVDEELSGIKGRFDGIKTVRELDGMGHPSFQKMKACEEVARSFTGPIVKLDRSGNEIGSYELSEIETQVEEYTEEEAGQSSEKIRAWIDTIH